MRFFDIPPTGRWLGGGGGDGHGLVSSCWSFPMFVPLAHHPTDSHSPLERTEDVR